jgi:hypothetical protein
VNKYVIICSLIVSFILNPGCACADLVTDTYIASALQGDLSDAHKLFNESSTDPGHVSDTEIAYQFNARFIDQSEDLLPDTGNDLADAVVLAYRNYWVKVLTRELSFQEGANYLENSLRDLLPAPQRVTPSSPQQEVFDQMTTELQQRGFYALNTPAPPLLDLFLWRREQNKRYTVRLTDRSQPVRVTFITEIYSLGWKEFATLGLISTTGWVEGDRLYCISDAYDRNSENFRISYLKHESRHLADFERFPGLASADLEYRAKLTELAFASSSLRSLLDDFTVKSAFNPDSPHAHANFLVTRDMYQTLYGTPLPETSDAWANIDVRATNKAARILLQQNTEMLASRND